MNFTITRDAGRFDCEGYLKDGEGAGIFRFTADAQYVQAMSALGFSGIDEEKQFAMAVHDVSLDFAKSMKGENLSGLNTDKLIAFRILRRHTAVHPRDPRRRPDGQRQRQAGRIPHSRRHAGDGARGSGQGRETALPCAWRG